MRNKLQLGGLYLIPVNILTICRAYKPNTTGNVSDTHSIIKILRLDIKVNAESEQGWMCYVLYKHNFQLPSTKREESEKYFPITEKYFPPTEKYIPANGAKCI